MGQLEELMQFRDSKRITPRVAINLGRGTGSDAIFLAQHGFDATGVAYASAIIEKAKREQAPS